jgi:hypothetical protein
MSDMYPRFNKPLFVLFDGPGRTLRAPAAFISLLVCSTTSSTMVQVSMIENNVMLLDCIADEIWLHKALEFHLFLNPHAKPGGPFAETPTILSISLMKGDRK